MNCSHSLSSYPASSLVIDLLLQYFWNAWIDTIHKIQHGTLMPDDKERLTRLDLLNGSKITPAILNNSERLEAFIMQRTRDELTLVARMFG